MADLSNENFAVEWPRSNKTRNISAMSFTFILGLH